MFISFKLILEKFIFIIVFLFIFNILLYELINLYKLFLMILVVNIFGFKLVYVLINLWKFIFFLRYIDGLVVIFLNLYFKYF